MVLSVDRARRLLALHHRLQAVHDDAGQGRHRHFEPRPPSIGPRASQGRSSPPAVERQRVELHYRRPGGMARRPWYQSCPWRAAPSSDLQSKIERWHQTLKNRILLENYYLPGDLEAKIGDFVANYNHLRYHESIANLTPADVYFGRAQTILLERESIKRPTIQNRRLQHRGQAA